MSPKEHDIKRRDNLKAKKQEKAGNAVSPSDWKLMANYRFVENNNCSTCKNERCPLIIKHHSWLCDLWEGSK